MRGSLIVLEGCDRAGKTTQCKGVVQSLLKSGTNVKYINFPDRRTKSGEMINAYLTNKQEFNDATIHLLFTLNRWEARDQMEKDLLNGVTLVVDRYSYSGVAYSAAKGVDFNWCKNPESGLLKPDLVIYLTLSAKAMAERGGFGNERYEIPEFQQKVLKHYERMNDSNYWQEIDADKSEDELRNELIELIRKTMQECEDKPLKSLW